MARFQLPKVSDKGVTLVSIQACGCVRACVGNGRLKCIDVEIFPPESIIKYIYIIYKIISGEF